VHALEFELRPLPAPESLAGVLDSCLLKLSLRMAEDRNSKPGPRTAADRTCLQPVPRFLPLFDQRRAHLTPKPPCTCPSDNTKGCYDVIENAKPIVMEACAAVLAARAQRGADVAKEPFVIADYGAADGTLSMFLADSCQNFRIPALPNANKQ